MFRGISPPVTTEFAFGYNRGSRGNNRNSVVEEEHFRRTIRNNGCSTSTYQSLLIDIGVAAKRFVRREAPAGAPWFLENCAQFRSGK